MKGPIFPSQHIKNKSFDLVSASLAKSCVLVKEGALLKTVLCCTVVDEERLVKGPR